MIGTGAARQAVRTRAAGRPQPVSTGPVVDAMMVGQALPLNGALVSVHPDTGAEARGRILDVAAGAFMRGGFASTTIDDIADQLGATKGLVYYHFRSKFDIFLAVYEEGMRRVSARVAPLASAPGAGKTRLIAMSIAHIENLMIDPGYHHVIHQGVREQNSAALKTRQRDQLVALNQLRDDYEDLFRGVITDGITDKSLRALNPRLLTRTLLSNLNAVDMWYHPVPEQNEADIRDLAGQIVDIIIGGIATEPTAPIFQPRQGGSPR